MASVTRMMVQAWCLLALVARFGLPSAPVRPAQIVRSWGRCYGVAGEVGRTRFAVRVEVGLLR